jgi:hypothetical protein
VSTEVLNVFLVLIIGVLAITMVFYGGELVLRWLEKADPPRFVADSAGEPGAGSTNAGASGAKPSTE